MPHQNRRTDVLPLAGPAATCYNIIIQTSGIGNGSVSMINRRRTLQALFSCVATGFACRSGIATGGLMYSGSSAANDTASSLEELLRTTIEVCRAQPAATEFQGLFEHALFRVHQLPDESPAFWQSCADALSRLDVVLSRGESADLFQGGRSRLSPYQLGSLRKLLADRTVQAIGRQQPD